jgi:hypothetical protein
LNPVQAIEEHRTKLSDAALHYQRRGAQGLPHAPAAAAGSAQGTQQPAADRGAGGSVGMES